MSGSAGEAKSLEFQNLLTGLRHSGAAAHRQDLEKANVSKPSNRSKAFREEVGHRHV